MVDKPSLDHLDCIGEQVELDAPGVDTPTDEKIAHVFDERSVHAVNAALFAGRPLLVRGEPGVGKTQLARAVAKKLSRILVSQTVDGRTEAQDLCYRYDEMARLAKAQILNAVQATKDDVQSELHPHHFVEPAVLWWAFDYRSASRQVRKATAVRCVRPDSDDNFSKSSGVVALIDEIDKADSGVPNGLLQALGEGRFPVPAECGTANEPEVRAQGTPLVIATTNEERALPDAFLRRCVVLQLRLPTDDDALMVELIKRGRAHFRHLEEPVLREAARQLLIDRKEMQARELSAPGQAEYLDLLRAVSGLSRRTGRPGLALLQDIKEYVFVKHPADPGGL